MAVAVALTELHRNGARESCSRGHISLETLSHETTWGLMGEAVGHTKSNEHAVATDM